MGLKITAIPYSPVCEYPTHLGPDCKLLFLKVKGDHFDI